MAYLGSRGVLSPQKEVKGDLHQLGIGTEEQQCVLCVNNDNNVDYSIHY